MATNFVNDGIVDLVGLTTMGVHVKADSTAVGFFGTGFKYAVAVILRNGGRIELWRGLERYTFSTKPAESRGKTFQIVSLNHPDGTVQELGFTTDMGKLWEPWMAYREFRCNATDEGGRATAQYVAPAEGTTLIRVSYFDALDRAHEEDFKYFISSAAVHSTELFTAHPQHEGVRDTDVFYKGVRVGQWTKPAMFSYNISCFMALTEDRTLSGGYTALNAIRRGVSKSDDKALVKKILTAPVSSMESEIDFSAAAEASDTFLTVCEEILAAKPLYYNRSIRGLLVLLRGAEPYDWVEPSQAERQMLLKAEKIVNSMGFDTSKHNIKIVASLGGNALGEVYKEEIYLAPRVFHMGTKMVAGTLLEEMIHITTGMRDESRELQNFLIDLLMTQREIINGEAL